MSYVFNKLTFLMFFTLLIRFIALNFVGDTTIENEWRVILSNLSNFGSFAFRSFDGNLIPTVYMPPLYIFFLFALDSIKAESIELVKLVIFIQILISTVSVLLFYKLNQFFFTHKISLISTVLFSFFPLNIFFIEIYKISSTSYHFSLYAIVLSCGSLIKLIE